MLIAVRVPGVVVLIGAAGSGKSTLAARLFHTDEILSSDDLRGAVSGDPADQSATRMAFDILHRELTRRLAAGRLVVVDATNLTAGGRSAVVRRAVAAGVPAVAIVLTPPAAVVHARNASRSVRVVPAAVVDRHLAAVASLGPDPAAIASRLVAEGFADVHVLANAIDDDAGRERIAIARRPSPVRRP